MKNRPNWKPIDVDHSILVAHDIPRGEVWAGLLVEWNEWLARVASRINLLRAFDELWLVTPFDVVEDGKVIQRRALRICGEQLSQRSAQAQPS